MRPADEIYWGECHDNTYQFDALPAPLDEVLRRAASHLDFYAAAYYTAMNVVHESADGARLRLEGWKPPARLDREWAEVQEATRAANRPGQFVTFPGYEWQGDGSGGDHNVFFPQEGGPLVRANALPDLYQELHGQNALAIPHHPAYLPGRRGRDWRVHDETLSPFVEIFSGHGCSENDTEGVPMRTNPHMGPAVAAGTYQAALDRGLHLGCVASTDNWGMMPGHYGRGRIAVLAPGLTRQHLWHALRTRHVYAATGDRVELFFNVNDVKMGSIVATDGPRRISVGVRGTDAVERVEILRGNRVVVNYSHVDMWEWPRGDQRCFFKFRVEAGWGPDFRDDLEPEDLDCELLVDGGRIVGYEPCWVSPGQGEPVFQRRRAQFRFRAHAGDSALPHQNANVFEIESYPAAELTVRFRDRELRASVAELAAGSRLLWDRADSVERLDRLAGLVPESPERDDVYYFMAYKMKLHRPVPEVAYVVHLDLEDEEPLTGETNYRVRVVQRNGQRAWSSPIWVRPQSL